ncbi:hypothetical protein UlMin_014008 [Ulmus minor]
MMNGDCMSAGNGNTIGEFLCIPKGGPIYLPNTVTSITSVPYFQSSLLLQLQDLEVEICSDASQVSEEEISVDDLKIFTDEELVDMAMKEAFKEGENVENPSTHSGKSSKERNDDNGLLNNEDASLEVSGREANSSAEAGCNKTMRKSSARKRKTRMGRNKAGEEGEDAENPSTFLGKPSNEERGDDHGILSNKNACLEISVREANDSAEADCHGTMRKSSSRKRKPRRGPRGRNHIGEETYIARVEEIAKIKKKQDEDKAAVRLHSFNPSCQMIDNVIPSSEKTEWVKPLRSASAGTKVKSSSINEFVAVMHPEVVLSIEVHHNIKRWLKTQEFLVLGRQTLTELRDKIYCLSDQVMQKSGQHDPSGYFLIEDVFCNDLRDPSAINYSEPIFDWLQDNEDEALKKWEAITTGELQPKQKAIVGDVGVSQLPRFRAVDMHKTRFLDLKFRLGTAYLYCHQGDCKHTIVIRDMRLFHPEDVQNKAAYPMLIFQLRPRLQKCHVCKIYRATKVSVDDKWAQGNPCYFCDNCYYLLHYKDGSLLYNDFSIYDYLHD